MKILITGATGLVGIPLCKRLLADGHQLVVVSRNKQRASEILGSKIEVFTEEELLALNSTSLSGLNSVINLAGEPLVEGRWTQEKKTRINSSRGPRTERLIQQIQSAGVKLESFVSASAMGIYGDRGDEILDEESSPGAGFLAEVCKEWEQPVVELADKISERHILLRISLVLSKSGGFLGEIGPIFKAGLGGRLADGKAYMSWIHIDDLVEIIVHSVVNKEWSGAINVSAPQAVTNSVMTNLLGKVLSRPTLFPVPSFGLKLMFGEKASMLLASCRLAPKALERFGYKYKYADLSKALQQIYNS